MARLWRVHHPSLPRRAGASIELSDAESRHVRRVLRLRPGQRIAVFDGEGSEWDGHVASGEGERVRVVLDVPVESAAEPALEVVLYQASCKPERMDWIVQKATEIGVAAVAAFAPGRAEGRILTDRRVERWRRIAVEACKQSGRSRIPRVEKREDLPPPPPDGLGLLLDPARGAAPMAGFCAGDGPPPGRVWLAVGPEGGFTRAETETWLDLGWRRAGLGPRTLRADTAGVVAAAIVLHRWGDLGSAPRPCRSC